MSLLQSLNLGSIHDLTKDEAWTGQELSSHASKRTQTLLDAGGPKGTYLFAHANSLAFFADLLAVWRTGGCAVCANPGLTAPEWETITSFIGPDAILTNGPAAIPTTARRLSLADASDGPTECITPNASDPALILFTSGTTGQPKAVVLSYGALEQRLRINQTHISAAALARTLCVLPTHFGHGLIGNALTPLLAGHDLFLAPGQGIHSMAGLGRLIDDNEISFLSSVPSFWKLALRLSDQPGAGSLRRISIGSAPLAAALWNDVISWSGIADVANMFGTTETANWCGGASAADMAPADGLIGTVWEGEAQVRNADGRMSVKGEGEILVRTPGMMTGYLKRPEASAEVLKDGWYGTGDTGHIDGAGRLWLSGRSKYAINVSGITVHPEEIDLLFETHADVAEACAFAVEDHASGDALWVAVAAADRAAPNPAELLDWARSRIRAEALPRKIVVLPAIPKTDRGKVRREDVAKAALEAA